MSIGMVAAVTAAAVTAATAAIAGQRMFVARIVPGGAHMAFSIPGFIPLEVIEWLSAAPRQGSPITVPRIVTVIHVAIEAMRSVEPWAGSDKDPSIKPVGPVIAIGCAVIRRIVKVPIGAYWRHAEVDADGDLGRSAWGSACEQCECKNRESKYFELRHSFSLIYFELKTGPGVVWKTQQSRNYLSPAPFAVFFFLCKLR